MNRKLLSLITLLAALTAAGAADDASSDSQPAFHITRLRQVTIFVRDYDEALRWYTNKLGFVKVEDRAFGGGQRWLVVAPAGQKDLGIVLAREDTGSRTAQTGKAAEHIGTTKYWVFDTDDCQKTFEVLSARGVKFSKPPQKLPWGTQAEFLDLYGNQFVLLSPPGKPEKVSP